MTYTYLQRPYFNVASALHDALEEQGILYAIVGGSGVQASIVDAVARHGLDTIKQHKAELQNLLRPTKDIDIGTLNGSNEKMFSVGKEIAEACGAGYNPMLDSRALKFEFDGQEPVYVQYELAKDDFKGLPEIYESVVKDAKTLKLCYNGKHAVGLKVAKPEYLIASKLTRGADKDKIDISHLLTVCKNSGIPIQLEDIRAILKGSNKGELFKNLERICLDLGIAS